MTLRVFVPRDAAAVAVGADEVAEALRAAAGKVGAQVQIVRNGSRGMLWLEPLVEVATPAGRVAYGPVAPEDVPSLFDAGLPEGGAHPLGRGPADAMPFLARSALADFPLSNGAVRSVRLPVGWNVALADAGLVDVRTFSYLVDKAPPPTGQVREAVHSRSMTGGMAPRSRGTFWMNQAACCAPERQK